MNASLRALGARLASIPRKVAGDNARLGWLSGPILLIGAWASPVCRAPMRPTGIGELAIDACAHGTWFDARESRLFTEVAWLARPKASSTPDPALGEPPRGPGLSDDLRAVGAAVVGMFKDVLGMLFTGED